MDHALGLLQLVVAEDGVESYVDRHIIYMGEIAECADVVKRVASRGACTEFGCTDIDGIGAMQDGLSAARQILGRSQQFDTSCHRSEVA